VCSSHLHLDFPSGEAVGQGPRRAALQEAVHSLIDDNTYWREMGDVLVPNLSPVTDAEYWRVAGALLAVVLLSGGNLHPVSPAVIYALLSNVHRRADPSDVMHVSLSFIRDIQSSKVQSVLPWMIIPPRKDWRTLPDGHRTLVRDVMTGLDLEVNNHCCF
jgi:hypothetical protein